MSTEPGLNTRVIHHGESFASQTGTVMPPIFPSSTFAHGNTEGFDYTRSGNPNFRILDRVLASLEEAAHATVFASGVSAITAVVSQLQQGDLVLCEENLYGCTVRLFEQVFAKFGLRTQWVDFTKPDAVELIERSNPAMVWLESPTNPLLKVIDLKAVCSVAREHKVPVVVDNTFATALVQRPLQLGATLSLTSTTKYINGHSDALGGVVCTNDPEWQQKMVFSQKALGLQPSPFDCWLITRGIKTLPLRLKQQMANAAALADLLALHPSVNWVRYPHRHDHPQHTVAKQQMAGGGAIVTVSFNTTQEQTYALCKRLRWFTMAESLGGIESLICHPATMTHAAVAENVKRKLGIDDGLVRLSVGCEDLADLQADLQQALEPHP
ncbi:PLP-dependent aspartate aminotransferase family protein [Synechococcus sp. CC9616]|uniref:trans-sulfuration enzyme family protein n=1 Tax=Synechococcus sp. CC9616 TaxID=110663 RepID=UPI0004B28726|nr:PLP-dependent aspartate aminotransferase family protein [Synechococcus sp. CC9616]